MNRQLGFAPHGFHQVPVEIRIQKRVRLGILQVLQMQPLPREVRGQRLRFGVRQHAAHLLLQRGLLLEFSFARQRDQLIVGSAAPKEVG